MNDAHSSVAELLYKGILALRGGLRVVVLTQLFRIKAQYNGAIYPVIAIAGKSPATALSVEVIFS
ncbi:MAG: hypothetical protein LBD91_06535 [Prevotellaceae bacterium]|jgi:hypothetical protein|nr:hypothetical protein [Prevotellaceae bacterium]